MFIPYLSRKVKKNKLLYLHFRKKYTWLIVFIRIYIEWKKIK